ncbi:MAG: protein jag [Dehalococcoidales bacterium]|nr:protein jag [Dehalococcoidales bacterium]
MKNLEIKGKTVEKAIQHALKKLGVSREELKISVLKEGKQGVFGLGAEEAMIKVEELTPTFEEKNNIVKVAKNILEELLAKMGVVASVFVENDTFNEDDEEAAPIVFNIEGDDLGILIGRRGQTLSCLQYIVRLILGHQLSAWVPIIIDIEGYKKRRYESLRVLAENIAEQVKVEEKLFMLEPMPAYERRIIHLALMEHPDVITQSIGEGEARKVVILPKE